LYLIGDVNDYHVGLSGYTPQLAKSDSGSKLRINLVPPPLQTYLDQIQMLLSQAIMMHLGPPLKNDLWPTVLLHGPIGCGKMTICTATALKLGLNFFSLNAVHLVGDTSAYTEAKLKSLVEKAKSLLPCLIYIKNVHVCSNLFQLVTQRFICKFYFNHLFLSLAHWEGQRGTRG